MVKIEKGGKHHGEGTEEVIVQRKRYGKIEYFWRLKIPYRKDDSNNAGLA